MPPTDEQIEYATDALREEAGVWDGQSGEMARIAGMVEGLGLTRLEAGMFQLIVSPYNSVVNQVAARCQEGAQRMSDIADALTGIARDTDETEETAASQFTGP